MFAEFEKWINAIFKEDDKSDVVALNFNIYEDANNKWSIEIVGTSSFDEEAEDWACDEITDFGTRDNPFSWHEDTAWEEVLSEVKGLVKKYLESGRYSEKLKEAEGIGIGFVDGDLELIHVKR